MPYTVTRCRRPSSSIESESTNRRATSNRSAPPNADAADAAGDSTSDGSVMLCETSTNTATSLGRSATRSVRRTGPANHTAAAAIADNRDAINANRTPRGIAAASRRYNAVTNAGIASPINTNAAHAHHPSTSPNRDHS